MSSDLPFRYSYWGVPGKILAGCCPVSIDPGAMREQLSGLMNAGLTLVVSLMEVSEMELFSRFYETYEAILPSLAGEMGRPVRLVRFPIPDRSIPTTEQMTAILSCIREEVDSRASQT